jgi:hypothetical protein
MMMDVNLESIIPRKMEERKKEKKRSKRMWRRRRV